jgi:glucokinase
MGYLTERFATVKKRMIGATSSLVLGGDIGGTKTRLGVFSISEGRPHLLLEKTYPSAEYKGLLFILREFLEGHIRVASACLGVAGPVIRGVVKTTNLPWVISTVSLQKELHIERTEVINDLVANAYGIAMLRNSDFETLNKGRKVEGNAGLISAGTGLGEAVLFWDGEKYIPSPSEGGHIEFGPRNRLEIRLLEYLFSRFDHVSYERILSGAGIFNIYQFLRGSGNFGQEPDWLTQRIRMEDPAAVITEMAWLKKNRLCVETINLFTSIYGAAAGNLCLKVMALGGIYLGGGITPRLIWKLKDGTFMKAFKEKGRYSTLMAQVSVKAILNDRTALLGAAYRAMKLLERGRGPKG